MSDFQDYVQGLQMLGGVLSLPRSVQYAQEDALRHRKLLEGTGIDPADINAMYPDAPLHWLRAGPDRSGIGGKILGGVGDVGALLSTIAGQPIGPPRLSVSDLAESSKLRSKYKEQQTLNELAKTETDPVGKALLSTGTMDGYARWKAAQLRAQGGGGGMFGTSALGMRSRLAWLKANQPDSPDIPALERGIAEEDKRHPIPTPPTPRDPAAEYRARHNAIMEARKNEAQGYGYKPGTDEYNYFMSTGRPPLQRGTAGKDLDYNFFFKQALEQEQRRAANESDEVNMDTVKGVADKGWQAYQDSIKPKGGTTPPATPTPPTGARTPPPKAPPEPTPGPVSTGETAPPGATGAAITQATPEQLTARKTLIALAQQQGVDPRGLRETHPDLWAAADLTGTEDLPAEQFYQLLGDPVAFAQWRAGQAQQSAQQSIPPGPEGSPLNVAFDYNALTPQGQTQADQIKADMQAGKIAPGVAAARLQALPRRP
jgi:hypothetical protein